MQFWPRCNWSANSPLKEFINFAENNHMVCHVTSPACWKGGSCCWYSPSPPWRSVKAASEPCLNLWRLKRAHPPCVLTVRRFHALAAKTPQSNIHEMQLFWDLNECVWLITKLRDQGSTTWDALASDRLEFSSHPGENREKRTEDGSSNRAGPRAWSAADTPLVDHCGEWYQVSNSPET